MLRLRLSPSPGGARLLRCSLEICTRGEAALIVGGPLGGRRSLIRLRLRSHADGERRYAAGAAGAAAAGASPAAGWFFFRDFVQASKCAWQSPCATTFFLQSGFEQVS